MISDKEKVIFVHVRKAGGSSIKAMFPNSSGEYNEGALDFIKNTDERIRRYYKFAVI